MNEQCAISGVQTNERAARLVAFLVFALLAVFALSPAKWVWAVLVFDFLARAFLRGRVSPLAVAARLLLRSVRVRPVLVDAGPKLFAARLGLLFSLLLGAVQISGGEARIVAAIFALPVGLEAFLGYCVGCKIHSLIQRARPAGRSSAEEAGTVPLR